MEHVKQPFPWVNNTIPLVECIARIPVSFSAVRKNSLRHVCDIHTHEQAKWSCT